MGEQRRLKEPAAAGARQSVSASALLKTSEMFEWQRVAADASAGVGPSLIKFFDFRAEMTVMQLSGLY